jgi:AraC-like DNA-binding protein
VSNALPLSMSNVNVPAAPASRPRPTFHVGTVALVNHPPLPVARPAARGAPAQPACLPIAPRPPLAPLPPPISLTLPERIMLARERIRATAEAGQRIRSYEVALDLDLSEFHFARQFRAAFGRSPHVYYDEVRAERARACLREGLTESEVARRVGFRRPAELRALLTKRAAPISL